MLSLSDQQLQLIMKHARLLPVEKRDLFLRRFTSHMKLLGPRRRDDAAVNEAVRSAITGLMHEVA
jgi:hypothetical protein